ncbi:MAG: DUF362 domain-containing protein [Methanocellales archaeon]|nr:DUF362 domain-containing protein [Methanocellales archaeon]
MVKSKVAVEDVHAQDSLRGVKKALASICASQYFKKDEQILVKPNYVTNDLPSTGVTTDPYVVLGVVEYLRDSGFENIIVAEGGCTDFNTLETFKRVGLTELIHDAPDRRSGGVVVPWGLQHFKLVDLNRDERVNVVIPNATKLKEVNVARTFFECDAIVSVSKLKVHCLATVTLNMKNMMGGILPKNIIHEDIHEKIVDLNRLFMPRLGVIDGIIGCQTHETGCDPVRSDVIVAGGDIVATDAVGAFLMGISPREVKHLELAAREKMGTNDLKRIQIMGEDIVKLQKQYARTDL